MEQDLKNKVAELEEVNRELQERIDRIQANLYGTQSKNNKLERQNEKLLQIIENLSGGIGVAK